MITGIEERRVEVLIIPFQREDVYSVVPSQQLTSGDEGGDT